MGAATHTGVVRLVLVFKVLLLGKGMLGRRLDSAAMVVWQISNAGVKASLRLEAKLLGFEGLDGTLASGFDGGHDAEDDADGG
jgi:hypothetical protein